MLGARVGVDPASVAQPRDDPAYVRLVHPQRATDLGAGVSRRRRMADLVEDSGFRQGNVAAGQAPVQQADFSRVEPVEAAEFVGEAHRRRRACCLSQH